MPFGKREIRNVRIERTFLGIEDHGIFTCVVSTLANALGQGFGTHDLTYKDYGIGYLRKVIETVGVDSWEALEGQHCRIDASHNKVHGIGHITEDKWFYPQGKNGKGK